MEAPGVEPSPTISSGAHLPAILGASTPKSSATGEWLYIFKPALDDKVLYLKIILRGECIVVSFHEDLAEQ